MEAYFGFRWEIDPVLDLLRTEPGVNVGYVAGLLQEHKHVVVENGVPHSEFLIKDSSHLWAPSGIIKKIADDKDPVLIPTNKVRSSGTDSSYGNSSASSGGVSS